MLGLQIWIKHVPAFVHLLYSTRENTFYFAISLIEKFIVIKLVTSNTSKECRKSESDHTTKQVVSWGQGWYEDKVSEMFLKRQSPVTFENSTFAFSKRQEISQCGRAGVYLVTLWTSPLQRNINNLSDMAVWLEIVLHSIIASSAGTTNFRGIQVGARLSVRDTVSAKVKSERRDPFQVNLFGNHLSWVELADKDWLLLWTFGISTLCNSLWFYFRLFQIFLSLPFPQLALEEWSAVKLVCSIHSFIHVANIYWGPVCQALYQVPGDTCWGHINEQHTQAPCFQETYILEEKAR